MLGSVLTQRKRQSLPTGKPSRSRTSHTITVRSCWQTLLPVRVYGRPTRCREMAQTLVLSPMRHCSPRIFTLPLGRLKERSFKAVEVEESGSYIRSSRSSLTAARHQPSDVAARRGESHGGHGQTRPDAAKQHDGVFGVTRMFLTLLSKFIPGLSGSAHCYFGSHWFQSLSLFLTALLRRLGGQASV